MQREQHPAPLRRECGNCTLCCRLLPVKGIGKPANTRCAHQRHTGCAVYRTNLPMDCALWSCRWLVGDDTADQSRPDRSHIVIDMMPDFITVQDNQTGAEMKLEVVQCWVDPKHPDAHKDPAFRAYAARRAAEGKLTLIRYSDKEGFTLIAPAFNSDNEWHEIHSQLRESTHSPQEIFEAISK